MIRSFKAKALHDCKRVFLNPEFFGERETIRYWREGVDSPPLVLNINVVVDADEDMAAVWNSEKAYQTDSNEPLLGQKTYVLYAALEDFGFTPVRHRMMAVGEIQYQVRDVTIEDGMLIVALRRMEE